MSLIFDDLITEAEKTTKTLEEYNAFMKGAAFVFRCVAKRNEPNKYGTSSTISTIQSAIKHCIKLMPFMEDSEKAERHIKSSIEVLRSMNWLISTQRTEAIMHLDKALKELKD